MGSLGGRASEPGSSEPFVSLAVETSGQQKCYNPSNSPDSWAEMFAMGLQCIAPYIFAYYMLGHMVKLKEFSEETARFKQVRHLSFL